MPLVDRRRTGALLAETKAFMAASGATASAALDAWVRGLKVQGLWDFILTYPLRSGQNSSGVTVYSLGGLGTYNATQAGALPSTTSAGRVITAGSQVLQTANTPTGTSAALGVAVTFPSIASDTGRIISSDVTVTTQGLGIDGFGGAYFRRISSDFIGSWGVKTTNPTLIAVGQGFGTGSSYTFQDDSLVSTPATDMNNPQSALGIIGRGAEGAHLGTYAMSFYYDGDFSDVNMSYLYSLYKLTIGAGLGLP
jgi:hypothetical protein